VFYFTKRKRLLNNLKKLKISGIDKTFLSFLTSLNFNQNKVTLILEVSPSIKINPQNLENEIQNITILSGFKKENITIITSTTKQNTPKPQKYQLQNIKNIICVASCKGGVGKSTMAINLAKDYEEKGYKVGILDADIYGPSIPLMLQIENQTPVIENSKFIPILHQNIKIFSMGFLTKSEDALAWRGSMITKTIKNFFEEVEWGELDVLVIDLPPGTGDTYLSLLGTYNITGALLVSSPHKISLEELKKTISLFKKFQINILGVVENMIENQDYSSNLDFKIDREKIQKEGFLRLKTNFANQIKLPKL
jgi:ATP-binding protein involved in chromosome partitioning